MKVAGKKYGWIVGLVLASASSGGYAVAAGVPVVDPARNIALGVQLVQALELHTKMLRVVSALESIGESLRIDAVTRRPLQQVHRLTGDAGALGFQLRGIFEQFDRVFPNKDALDRLTLDEHRLLAELWEREMVTASMAAGNLDTTVRALERNSERSMSVLNAARQQDHDSGSQVAGLQSLVESLAAVSSTTSLLVQTVSVNQRQKTTQAAVEQARKSMQQQHRKNWYDGWTTGWQPSPGLDDDMYGGN